MSTTALTVSPHEAAAKLGLGRQAVYRLLRAGLLPAVRVGKRPHYRIPLKALEEVLAHPERLSLATHSPDRP